MSNARAIDLIPIVLSNLMYKNWGLLQGVSSVGQKPYTAVMIVPTGTGATIGGFAGDALPVARALASVVDCLITHPNVSNRYCMMHSFDPLSWVNMWRQVWSICFLGLEYAISKVVPGLLHCFRNLDPIF